MRRVAHERYISQSQKVNCDLARRYVGLNLSQQYYIIYVRACLIDEKLITAHASVFQLSLLHTKQTHSPLQKCSLQ